MFRNPRQQFHEKSYANSIFFLSFKKFIKFKADDDDENLNMTFFFFFIYRSNYAAMIVDDSLVNELDMMTKMSLNRF